MSSSDETLAPCKHIGEAVYGFVTKTTQSESSKTGKPADWLALPVEIWLEILSYIPQAELYLNVNRTCHQLHALCRDASLWTTLDFNKWHEDLISTHADLPDVNDPIKVSKAHFKRLLAVFCDRITSLNIRRSTSDGFLTTTLACMCTSLRKLDLGFCNDVNLIAICQRCPRIVELNLERCDYLQDDDFSSISSLERLEKLCVSRCFSLTNKFLSYVHGLLNFRALICDGVNQITEIGFIEFFQYQPLMEVLVLDGQDMSDDLAISASQLPNLVTFELSYCESLTSKSIYCFKEKYQLERLKFWMAHQITGNSIREVFNPDAEFQLRSFEITECQSMDDDALICLSQSCPHLRSLTLDRCWRISDRGLCAVVNNCRKLQRLSLVGPSRIRGVGWLNNFNNRLPYLQILNVTHWSHMEYGDLLNLVRSCPHLISLTLDYCCAVTDRGLCAIVYNCRKLQRLSLVGVQRIRGVGWLDNLNNRLPYLQFLDTACYSGRIHGIKKNDLLNLIRRKPTIEVYANGCRRICIDDEETSDTDSTFMPFSDDKPPE